MKNIDIGINYNLKDCLSTLQKDTKRKIQKNAQFFSFGFVKKVVFVRKREKTEYLDQTAGESKSLSHHNFQVDCKNVKNAIF